MASYARPTLRHHYFLAIPGGADVGSTQRADAAFGCDRSAVAGTAHSLRLPASWDLNRYPVRQAVIRLKPLLRFAHTRRVGGKVACAIKAQRLPQGGPQDWIDHCGRRLTL